MMSRQQVNIIYIFKNIYNISRIFISSSSVQQLEGSELLTWNQFQVKKASSVCVFTFYDKFRYTLKYFVILITIVQLAKHYLFESKK